MTPFKPGSFAGSVLFALIAALCLRPATALMERLCDGRAATLGYLSLVCVVYAALLTEQRSRRLAAVIVMAVAGAGVTVLGNDLLGASLVLTTTLAFARSRIALPRRHAHPWFVELCLGSAALLVAQHLFTNDALGLALALWAYLLVQSAYFLVTATSGAEAISADPFDVAAQRATELMDDA